MNVTEDDVLRFCAEIELHVTPWQIQVLTQWMNGEQQQGPL